MSEQERATALRYRLGRFETVQLDNDGKPIKQPPPCCYGHILHAPNCKYWETCT